MLSPADSQVVNRDDQLPGLRTILDPELFCLALRRMAPGHAVESARARYVRYKPRTSCLVAHEVLVGGEMIDVYARCHRDDQSMKVSNARLRMEVTGPLGHGLLTDPEAGIAVFVYPNDYEVKSLRKLFEGERTPRRLRRMLPAHPHLHHAVPTVLRYKPERRFVGRFDSPDGPSAVLRLYPNDVFGAVRMKPWAFKSSGPLHIPRIVGETERYGSLAFEWIDDPTLLDAIERQHDAVLEPVADAAVALHRQRPNLGAMYSESDYIRGIQTACASLASIDAALGKRASEQARCVEKLLAGRSWQTGAIHGDFRADQVLATDDRVTILDFDRAGYGDPGIDVGSFAAGSILLALTDTITMPRALEFSERFTDSYQRTSGTGTTLAMRAFISGALLLTAPESFRHRVEDWPAATARMLDVVDEVLSEELIGA